MPIMSSQVPVMTTASGASDGKAGITTSLSLQCRL